MGLFGGKKDTRPVDEGLARLLGSDHARVGALTPQIRELTRVDDVAERKRLTRARMIAFAQLPEDQRRSIAAAREQAWTVDRAILENDQKIVDEILPTLDANVRAAYPRREATSRP